MRWKFPLVESPSVLVVGGALVDAHWRVAKMPEINSYMQADSVLLEPGGKGLNVAMMLAHLGARVSMCSVVGDDSGGTLVRRRLQSAGIDVELLASASHGQTPITLLIEPGPEPAVVGWANEAALRESWDVEQITAAIPRLDAVIITFEAPSDVVQSVIVAASYADVPVFVNAAPMRYPADELRRLPADRIDVLVVNENEAAQIDAAGFEEIPAMTVVTLAERGAAVRSAADDLHVPTESVEAVDTTGAGDAFLAALVMQLLRSGDVKRAVEQGNRAGGHVAARVGTYAALDGFSLDSVE